LYRPSRLLQGATNWVSAFVRVFRKILNAHLGSIAEIFVDDVGVKGPNSRYGEEEVEGLPGVRRVVMEHLQNLDNVLADVGRAGATISGEKSDWWWNGVKIVRCFCGEAGRWPQASKVDKLWNWPRCENRTECMAFLILCIYYRIWIPEYAIVAGPLFRILRKDVEFQWETEEKQAMAILKEALYNAPGLKTLDVSDGAGQIVVGVDASLEGCGAIFQQEDENKDRHPCRYGSGLWNNAEKRYHAGKRECRGLMKALKKFRNYIDGVRFLVETDANTLVHQLNLPANDLPGALVTRWIAWIRLFHFEVKHVPGSLNGGPDGLSRRPRGEGESEPEEEDDPEETIEASLQGIRVEQGSDRKMRERPYEPSVGLRLAEEYKGRWKEIGEFLGNLKRPERMTTKEMHQFRREALKYLVSDGILYRRRKTNEPPAKLFVSAEQKWKAMEAAHELSGHRGRAGTLQKVVEPYGWPEMYGDVKDWVKWWEQCEVRAPLRYDEPLKSLTVSHLWQRVGMDISHMPKTEDRYHLLVVAKEYLRGWAEARPLKQGTSEKVADIFHKEVICRFATPESVVVDRGVENKKCTDLLLKCYNIRKITVTPYHAATNGVIEREHRPIADALSKLTACSDEPKEMWIDHLPAMLWADRITVRRTTGYSPFRLMFGQDAVLPIELVNLTWNTANWIQGIDDTASLIAAIARQLERRREDIYVAIQNLKESSDANKRYFDQAANLPVEDLQIGDLAIVHETKIEQSHGAKLDARWRGPYRVTEIAQSLGTYRLAELDGAELAGWIGGSRLKKFSTHNGGVHGTREISTPSTAQEEESEEFEEFEVEAVAGRKYIEGRWMYLIKWKDWEK